MRTIKKHNFDFYDIYHKCTENYKDVPKASGHSFSQIWKVRKSLVVYMVQFLDFSKLDILDIGCNNGLMGRELCNSLNRQNIETNIDGIDFVEEATLLAKINSNYRSTFVGDITDEHWVNNVLGAKKYEVALCCEVFLYINPVDYKNFFTTIYTHLCRNGYFLFVIPNVRSIYHLAGKAIRSEKFKHFFKYDYDLPLVISLLQEFNFNIISIYGAELFTNLKINLNGYNKLKNLFSFEIAILARKG